MRLYLIRHAKAEKESLTGRDEDRALTARGERQAGWLGAVLREREGSELRVVASPATRARQTARIIAGLVGVEHGTEPAIGLGAASEHVLACIASLDHDASWALVGHNPTLSRAVDLLTRGPGGPASAELRTGEAAVLEIDDPARAMGRSRLVAALRIPDAEDHR